MLHPHARALLDLMIERGVPPTRTLGVAEARRFYLERRHATQPAPQVIDEVRELQAPGPQGAIALRLYRHGEGAALRPALVFFHGGGWVMGDLDTHDTLCRQLAIASGCIVVSVDYRLAPEHPFPAAADDACAATRWLAAHAADLGLDASRLAVGGDSAGGNLAAVVALALRGEVLLAFQLLIYPATDQHPIHDSRRRNAEGYLLTADTMGWFHDHYITDAKLDYDWRASPLRHPDLTGLPPALVLTAGFDPLRDEGVAYAQRLSEAGVTASLLSFERQIHGFILMGRVIDEANEAVAICADALRRALKP